MLSYCLLSIFAVAIMCKEILDFRSFVVGQVDKFIMYMKYCQWLQCLGTLSIYNCIMYMVIANHLHYHCHNGIQFAAITTITTITNPSCRLFNGNSCYLFLSSYITVIDVLSLRQVPCPLVAVIG